jgi:hypothetical protein
MVETEARPRGRVSPLRRVLAVRFCATGLLRRDQVRGENRRERPATRSSRCCASSVARTSTCRPSPAAWTRCQCAVPRDAGSRSLWHRGRAMGRTGRQ